MAEVTRSCPLGAVWPLPWGYIHVLNHEKKNCIKSDFIEISLKLATNGSSDKAFLLTSKFFPWGLSALAPGLYTCIKSWKNCIKSELKDIFWNLQQMNEITRHFCWPQNFVPWGLSAPGPGFSVDIKILSPGAIYIYKIRLQRDLFETCNKWPKWQDVPVDIKISSPRGCQPLPRGYIYMYKIMKKKKINK